MRLKLLLAYLRHAPIFAARVLRNLYARIFYKSPRILSVEETMALPASGRIPGDGPGAY